MNPNAPPEAHKTRPLFLRLPHDLFRLLEEEATKSDRTLTAVVIRALRQHLNGKRR